MGLSTFLMIQPQLQHKEIGGINLNFDKTALLAGNDLLKRILYWQRSPVYSPRLHCHSGGIYRIIFLIKSRHYTYWLCCFWCNRLLKFTIKILFSAKERNKNGFCSIVSFCMPVKKCYMPSNKNESSFSKQSIPTIQHWNLIIKIFIIS